MMSSRKRNGSGSKRPNKGKIVQIYESFFKGEDPTQGNPNFWSEFFLLRPNISHLESEMQRLSGEQLASLKDCLNTLFAQCVEMLTDQHQIRVAVALQTLSALIQGVYRKAAGECNFDVIDVMVGFNAAEKIVPEMLERCSALLKGDASADVKALSLRLLLALASGAENVSQNAVLEHALGSASQPVFEALVHTLQEPDTRSALGHHAVLLLTILVNYRKQEGVNPFVVQLSILDNELALNGYSQVITASLSEFCWQFASQHTDPQPGGWLSSLTSMVGAMFVSDEGACRTQQVRANNAVLLALYEAVHLNRNFITTLVHSQTEAASSPPSPTATLDGTARPPPSDMTSAALAAANSTVASTAQPDLASSQPSNLLATFIEYCSIVTQDTKSEASHSNGKLCLLILTCISEDQYANSLMHDPNLVYRVQLHRAPMRHRKLPPDRTLPAQPLACAMLDLVVEFVTSHKMKRFPMELYLLSVGVAQRLVCYQKRCRVRLAYHWAELWGSLIALLRFLISHEATLAKKTNIFHLAVQVVNIFNLFITYGDTFLPSPASYDELYYEMIRMHQTFNNLHLMAMRYSSIEGDYKESAVKLANSLINVRAIISHFNPKIETWLTSQGLSTPSEEQILEVVRSNYDSLMLKLQDNLDQYERYSEAPKHTAFFTSMVRIVVSDTRQNVDFSSMASLQNVFQDFKNIS